LANTFSASLLKSDINEPSFYFYRFPDAKPMPRASLGKKRPKHRKNGNFRP
jgi:hypothetical protein